MIAKKFKEPVYVTRPLLPSLDQVYSQLQEVWNSKWITNNGPKHKELESKLKEYLKVDNAVMFSNGTLALELGLKSLDISGEVITTPFTFPATVQALDRNGLTPVFCDIEDKTLNIDASKIEKLITDKTSAILAVHVFGNPCNVEKIKEIADKYNLKVIYDGAHAFGSHVNGKSIGSYGDMTMFSFHATKLFNTIEGGCLVFKDNKLYEKLNLLKNFGIVSPEKVVISGTNAKLNEVQAAVGIEVLKIVKEERKRRKYIKKIYENGLCNIPGIKIVNKLDDENASYQYFTIEIDEDKYGISRDELHVELKKYNIITRKYFYPLCSEFEWYKHLPSAKKENLPVSHEVVKKVLSMPYYGELNIEDVNQICEIIRYIYDYNNVEKLVSSKT
ncbi:MAG TPA: aminotransferase [Terrisporobacter glycolicus]|uniref:DegT/DnrJ/EryC1/StrS family aminotransferase n=1 Tax=Terrisporobacter TaxID=1505652 RepID=UPI000E8D534E|nr:MULTISPECIES: DegT/DnrJ/EryC1/StrS family aminotransferase [Terrisporobacter]MBN9647255.1 DegT/DnrJ/EryC1/StrS family aminotransferase [Terrisporobacter glycolicus]HBI92568.1 aminotransferase [Terrisporobacter hibernicus]